MIIELQRRMVEAGRIRPGDRGPKGEPRKLTDWRLTSKDKVRLVNASELWGGEVREWEGHAGEWELYTKTSTLPIMLLPGQEPTTWYELWSKGGCQRRCDGQHELISDSTCLCGEERECKPHTRLSVLLPDLPGIGSWLLSSTGWNAAAELAGAADLLQRASAQGLLIPARLRLEQRVVVQQGQTRRFAVPVIDIDVSMRQLLGGNGDTPRQLPSGYTPIPPTLAGEVTLEQGLIDAESQVLAKPPRVPLPEDDDILDEPGAEPGVAGSSDGGEAVEAAESAPASDVKKPTAAQVKKLNLLVGKLREAERITTRQLWGALAKQRNISADDMIDVLSGKDEQGELHWSPLRDSLTRDEASGLIDRLERLAEKQEAAA